MFRLDGKIAVVTGGSRGIGRSIVEAFASAGAKVVVSSRDLKACEDVVDAVVNAGGEAIAIACDMGRIDDCEALAAGALAAYGKVDILVGNAAAVFFTPLADLPLDEFQLTMDTNTRGNFFLAQKLAPQMRSRNDGVVLFVTSTGGMIGAFGSGAYSMSKAAVMSFARTAAVEWGADNVRVNTIAPGLIETDMGRLVSDDPVLRKKYYDATPLRRLGRPEEIAALALCLATEGGTYVTGQTFIADGGCIISGPIAD